MADHVANPSDVVYLSDALDVHLQRAQADTGVSVADAITRGHGRLVADSVALTDGLSSATQSGPGPGEYLVLEEDGTSRVDLEESTDSIVFEEGGWTDHVLPLADEVNTGIPPDPGIEDSFSLLHGIGWTVSLADSVGVADNAVPKTVWANYTVSPADAVGLADSVSKVQGHRRTPADTVSLADSQSGRKQLAQTLTPADSVGVADELGFPDAGDYHTEEPVGLDAIAIELEDLSGHLELEEGGWVDHVVTPADSVALADSVRVDLSPARFSQAPAEVVVSPADGKARFSQAPAEVVVASQDQKARFSQAAVEAVVLAVPDARFSQAPAEVVVAPVWNERQAYYDQIRLDYPDGLWRLDEATGNFVDETGTHPFVPHDDVSYEVDGPTGTDWPAMGVTEGGGASQPSYSDVVDNFSFEAWVKYDAIGADNQVLFSNVNGGGWALTLNQNGKLQVVVNGTTYLAESTTALEPGTWYHVVVERRNGQWRYYVNGSIDTPNAGTAAPTAGPGKTMNLFGSADLTASMATASYWERALTGAEIKEHYGAVFEIVELYEPYQAHFVARMINPEDSSTWVVDDIGKRPQAVIFMGTNWSEMDTIVTTTGRGIFRGMIGTDPDTGQVIQTATSPIYPGDGQRVDATKAICMGNAAGGVHYDATVTLTDTGFVCDFDTVGPGSICALVLLESNHCCMIHGNSGTYDIGFRARSHIATGWWGLVGNRSNMHGSWFGGGQFMTDDLQWDGIGMCAHCYPTSNSAQYSDELTHISLSNGMFGVTYAFIGPFMRASNLHCWPPESANATTVQTAVDEGPGSFVIWDGYSGCGFMSKPAAAADAPIQTTLTYPTFGPAAVITYCTDGGQSQEQGGRGSGGFGVALADGFQWACLVDGGAYNDSHRAAYQTTSHGWISAVEPGGVHAGDIEFNDEGFITDTILDSTTAKSIVFHAMGFPVVEFVWIPQSYRLRVGLD